MASGRLEPQAQTLPCAETETGTPAVSLQAPQRGDGPSTGWTRSASRRPTGWELRARPHLGEEKGPPEQRALWREESVTD